MLKGHVYAALIAALLIPASLLADEIWGGPLVTFEKADSNKDGKIDKEEYERIIIDEFRDSDLNKDGYLSYEEMDERERGFLLSGKAAAEEQRVKETEYLRRHYRPFNHYDKNKNGTLDAGEYRGWGL